MQQIITAKSQKPIYSRIIYDEIRAMKPPGRFLKQDPKTKLWSDIGEKKALDKTRQALREGAPELLKEMEGGDSNEDGGKMKGGKNNIAQQQQMEDIPLRMSNLTDSMFSATSLGGFSLGDVFNSFNAGVNVGASGGGNNDGSGGIPGQIGGGASMDNMFGPGVGADDILAAAAQIQAQQQAIQQQAIQQQAILRQQQQQQQNNNQQQPQNMANLQAQLQLLKSMELQGGSNRSLGSNMDMGGNANSNQQQQQQQRNNSGMTIGTYDLNASSSAMSNSDISNFLSSMNNMANNSNNPGIGSGQQQMGNNNNSMNPNAIMYQQQMLQQAMLNQMNNNPNYSNNNNFQGVYDGHSSASTLPAGNLSSSSNSAGNNNNNNTFGNNANVASSSNNQFQGGYQEKSFNTTVPLKSPGNEGGQMPSMTEEEGNPSMFDNMDTKSPGDSGATGDGGGQRRPGNMRGGASGDVNSSFTRAQRIGLKNSFTQKRRPNRKMQNAEMHNSLKNSLMSIESLSLEDLDSDIFEMNANESASPGEDPGSSNTDRHGDHMI